MNFSKGLKHYRNLKGVTQKELAEAIETNNTTISNWEKGISKPDMDTLVRLSNYFGVATDDLIFFREGAKKSQTKTTENLTLLKGNEKSKELGKKPNLQNSLPNKDYSKDVHPESMVSDAIAPYMVDTASMTVIPIVDISAAAGAGAYNPDYITPENSLVLPPQMVRQGLHHCIKIKGDSMAPTLLDGGYIITRLLDRAEWANIKDEHVYVITTREGMTYIKRLRNRLHEFGFVVCTSDNPDKNAYRNFNLMEDEIHNIWYVEWYLSAKMPNIHATYYDQVQVLRDDMDAVMQFLESQFKKPIKES